MRDLTTKVKVEKFAAKLRARADNALALLAEHQRLYAADERCPVSAASYLLRVMREHRTLLMSRAEEEERRTQAFRERDL